MGVVVVVLSMDLVGEVVAAGVGGRGRGRGRGRRGLQLTTVSGRGIICGISSSSSSSGSSGSGCSGSSSSSGSSRKGGSTCFTHTSIKSTTPTSPFSTPTCPHPTCPHPTPTSLSIPRLVEHPPQGRIDMIHYCHQVTAQLLIQIIAETNKTVGDV